MEPSLTTIHNLPSEILVEIFAKANALEVGMSLCVCKKWNRYANDEKVWQALAEKTVKNYVKDPEDSWKDYYRLNRKNAISNIVPCLGGFLFSHGNRITYARQDNTIFNLHSQYELPIFHTGVITYLFWQTHLKFFTVGTDRFIRGQELFVSNSNNQITVDAKQIFCEKLHNKAITAFKTTDNWFFAGFDDGVIKIWERKKLFCMIDFKAHEKAITCLQRNQLDMTGHILVTGSTDHTIKIWHIGPSNKPILHKTLNGHKGAITCLSVHLESGYIISASNDKTIKIWNSHTHACTQTIQLDHNVTAMLKRSFHKIFYTGGSDGSLREWKLNVKEGKWQPVDAQTHKNAHNGPITSLRFGSEANHVNTKILLSSSADTVKIWHQYDIDTPYISFIPLIFKSHHQS